MRAGVGGTIAGAVIALGLCGARAADYVPGADAGWRMHTPAQEGFDAAKLQAAIDFATAHEVKLAPELAGVVDPRDLTVTIPLKNASSGEPFSNPLGPLKAHAPANGLIIRHGVIVAEWGRTHDIDMTFSVSKTFLTSLAGIALERGLIKSLDDRVIDSVQPTPDFLLPHNQPITWNQMMRQTSGWVGTMWGKPWWADRPGATPWAELAAGPPPVGTQWKYSDVRMNALALALTRLWQRPLPDVLRENVMTPIGATDGWHWEGYDNSWITLKGKRVQVPSAGGHWGGGMFLSARDLARLGLLGLNEGRWGDRQIWSDRFVTLARTPTRPNPGYGFANWFLNTGRKMYPAAPEDCVAFIGDGSNVVFIDYRDDVVAVVRWIDGQQTKEFVRLLLEAMAAPAP